jgi:hypothetical protein
MIACDENVEDVELDGTTWSYLDEDGTIVLTFSSTNFTWSKTAAEGRPPAETYIKTGTYSVSGNNVTLTPSDDSATLTLTSSGNTLTLIGYYTFTKQ